MLCPFRVVMPRHQPAAVDRHQLGQVFVHAGAMQALVEILPEYLPVAVHYLPQGMPDDEVFYRPVGEVAGARVEAVPECRARFFRQVDEHHAAPFRHRDAIERKVGLLEPCRHGFGRHAHQVAAQRIGPCMIGTGYQPRLQPPLAFAAKPRTAVAAGVVEGAQRACLVTDDEDVLLADVEGPEFQRLGDVAGTAHKNPVAVPDGVEVAPVGPDVEIFMRGQTLPGFAQAGVGIGSRQLDGQVSGLRCGAADTAARNLSTSGGRSCCRR